MQRYEKYLKLHTQMCTFPQNLRTRLRSFCKILHSGLRRNGRFSTGRPLPAHGTDRGPSASFDVPATGVYLVKVGNAPVRRVVVVR